MVWDLELETGTKDFGTWVDGDPWDRGQEGRTGGGSGFKVLLARDQMAERKRERARVTSRDGGWRMADDGPIESRLELAGWVRKWAGCWKCPGPVHVRPCPLIITWQVPWTSYVCHVIRTGR